MTNTQGNLFEQPKNEVPTPKPADVARLELTPEAAAKRQLDKEARERRAQEAAQKRQDQINRAAKQGVDLRTHEEVRQSSAERGITRAREALDKSTPQPDIDN